MGSKSTVHPKPYTPECLLVSAPSRHNSGANGAACDNIKPHGRQEEFARVRAFTLGQSKSSVRGSGWCMGLPYKTPSKRPTLKRTYVRKS